MKVPKKAITKIIKCIKLMIIMSIEIINNNIKCMSDSVVKNNIY